MLIGYLRARADDAAALAGHRQALQDAGCGRVVEDLATTVGWGQPELRALLDGLEGGEVLVVPELGCLGSTLADVVRRMQRIAAAGAGLRSLAEGIDTTANAAGTAAQVVASLAGLDRGVARKRISAGLAATRAAARRGGRRPKLAQQQRLEIAEAVISGRSTAARMSRKHKVSAPTVSRILAEHRASADVSAGEAAAVAPTIPDERIAGVLLLAALDERLAIVGTSGSGKTYAAKVLVEQLMAQGARVCIVDPLGVWWGLRAGAEGGASPPPRLSSCSAASMPTCPCTRPWVGSWAAWSARTSSPAWWTCPTSAAPTRGAGS